MIWFNILWPVFAMVALTFVVLFTLMAQRLRHLKRTPPTRENFATQAAAQSYFEPVELPAGALRNLFETPMLFFALVPLLIVTRQAWPAQVMLAWAFVGARVVHAVFFLRGNVRARFRAFVVSVAVLLAMWIGFFADTVAAAAAYAHAMQGLVAQP